MFRSADAKVLMLALAGMLAGGAVAAPALSNPLLAPWRGAHGGVPPFDSIRVEHFKPAIDAAMRDARRHIAHIADNPAPPSFDNTIVALERAGRTYDRVTTLYWLWSGSLSSPALRDLDHEMKPKMAAFNDELVQNEKLFRRIAAVQASPALRRLTPEQQRLVSVRHTEFAKQGAGLAAAQKLRVAAINQRLSVLQTQFAQNELADEENEALVIDDPADLAGLSSEQVDAAAAEAKQRGRADRWVFANTRSAIEPFLTESTRRPLREKAWRMWTSRGDHGEHDNRPLVVEILQLRAERSRLLGFPSFAHWRLADTMAREPERAMRLMTQVFAAAAERVRHDVAAMQALIDAENGGFALQPWDYWHYADKLRRAQYDFDAAELRPYLQLDKVREAMFAAAGRLYGLRFVPVRGVPVFHRDVRVWRVLTRDGRANGLWYFDPYARAGKNSGAWMGSYRSQQRLDGSVTPLVSNNANFIPAAAGQPVLISWDDAITMFHEFGHALHGLASSVTYPSLSGPATLVDFVEFPSQLNEHWLPTKEVLGLLVNAEGQPLPQALVDKVLRARNFNRGFTTAEYVASAIVDMKLHLASPPV
ncbi:MAG TPA: M3 family metallopeptidase, partial [Albitalea sp.]|nr:M3 family metallopeptidase [Albitalea sp.]